MSQRRSHQRLAPTCITIAAPKIAAHTAGLSTADLPSGAVHDAGEISRIAPMGMIFVPSRDGISHAPQEFSSWDDIANGTEVLYRTILRLDQSKAARL